MSTSFIRSSNYDGLLAIETLRSNGESVRNRYVFKRSNDYKRSAIEVLQLSTHTALVVPTGFTLIGSPTTDDVVSLWADGTDMPIDMAKAMINHVWPNRAFVLNHVEYDEQGGVISFDFEVV